MKKNYAFLLILISLLYFTQTNAQKIARQVLSNQGASIQLDTGQVITQTIGQNGIVGSFNGNKGIQGFQQPLISKFLVLPEELKSKLVVYPNPFKDILKVNVPDVVDQTNFLIQIFDSSGGKLIYSQNTVLENATLSIDLGQLFSSTYILNVSSSNVNFSCVIFKN